MTLEEILQTYFNCKTPFKNNGDLSEKGYLSYKKLVNLIYSLDSLGVLKNNSSSEIVDKLDEITNEIY